MASGLYIVAATDIGTVNEPHIVPKYIPAIANWCGVNYGRIFYIVRANLTPAQETALEINSDFFTVPDLFTNLTAGQVNGLQTRLENLGIPANWINTTLTWKQVLRIVFAIMSLCNRANFLAQADFNFNTTDLDLRVNQIPLNTRNILIAAADAYGFDRSSITGSTTIRQALKILVDQWSDDKGGKLILGDIEL